MGGAEFEGRVGRNERREGSLSWERREGRPTESEARSGDRLTQRRVAAKPRRSPLSLAPQTRPSLLVSPHSPLKLAHSHLVSSLASQLAPPISPLNSAVHP